MEKHEKEMIIAWSKKRKWGGEALAVTFFPFLPRFQIIGQRERPGTEGRSASRPRNEAEEAGS